MKKTVLLVLCIAFSKLILACGCDMFIAYQGIMPSDYNGSIGVNMRQRFFKGAASIHNHSDGSAHTHGQMNQLLANYELNYRFFLTRKLIISGNIPMADYQLTSSNALNTIRNVGIGDPLVLLKYEILSPNNKEEISIKHRLLLGTGIKLPLGSSYQDFINDTPMDENLLQLQLGTGSFDWIINANYQVRSKSLGLQTDISFKQNFVNKFGFEKGKQLNVQANFFYQKKWSKTVMMAILGAVYENAASDKINKNRLINTGGSNLYGNVGAEIFMKKVSVYFNYQPLLSQTLNGFQMKNYLRFTIGMNHNFRH
mgnify:CR=1 FL=1